jgi:hypothetical protein
LDENFGAFFSKRFFRVFLLQNYTVRLVKDIPHDRYKIQVFNYNAKYIVKIELGQFEQTYKIGETDVYGLDDVERMITPELLSNALKRFVEMRSDWEEAFKQKNVQA